MRAVETLEQFAQAQGVPEKMIFGLTLALEECGSNIVNHALQRDARQQFQVAIEHTGDDFTIELRDRGPAFDPTAAAGRKPQADPDDLPGGWGIQLVRRYTGRDPIPARSGRKVLRLDQAAGPAAGTKSICSSRTKQNHTEHRN